MSHKFKQKQKRRSLASRVDFKIDRLIKESEARQADFVLESIDVDICPFCGSEGTLEASIDDQGQDIITCNDCGISCLD